MDIGEVRSLASQLSNAAEEIDQIKNRLTSALASTSWVGNDRNNFENDWTGSHTAALNAVVQAVRDASQVASSNADQQDQASNS